MKGRIGLSNFPPFFNWFSSPSLSKFQVTLTPLIPTPTSSLSPSRSLSIYHTNIFQVPPFLFQLSHSFHLFPSQSPSNFSNSSPFFLSNSCCRSLQSSPSPANVSRHNLLVLLLFSLLLCLSIFHLSHVIPLLLRDAIFSDFTYETRLLELNLDWERRTAEICGIEQL